ncbi:MAG: hypothetical protein LWW75_05525 [Chlorobiales bacterium]|nr:hypothetical protein [Chlorobiales bacterium]
MHHIKAKDITIVIAENDNHQPKNINNRYQHSSAKKQKTVNHKPFVPTNIIYNNTITEQT